MNPAVSSLLVLLLVFALASEGAVYEFYHAERDDLLELRDSLSSGLNLHSKWTGPPCYMDRSRWVGIKCSNSHVTGIHLPGIQLTGSLRPAALQNVPYLASLNLSDNALHGDLPALRGLARLRNVSFAGNKFSGPIPAEYAALPNLTALHLQDNLLVGTIPPFSQATLSSFNVSYNFLQGSVPPTPALQRFPMSSYDHNSGLCGRPLDKPCPGPPPPRAPPSPAGRSSPPPSGRSGPKRWELWGLISLAVGAVLIPVMVIFCFLCFSKRNRRDETAKKGETSGDVSSEFTVRKARVLGDVGGANRGDALEFLEKSRQTFNLDDLLRSSAEVLGKGKLGTTYKAMLELGPVVAVKRVKEMGAGVSKKEFALQMQMLGSLRHENLVEIIAYYYSKDERVIVCEYVPDGSLFQLLHENRGVGRIPLNWISRLNIAKGIARGLAHLHHSLHSHRVPHANLKSTNILIQYDRHQYNPKLTDFGFLPLLNSPQNAQKLAVGSTPEFTQGKRLNHKADIYCLGLVLLEIITGQVTEDRDGSLPERVASAVKNEWTTDVLDLEIVAEKERYPDMMKLMDIALQCTAMEPGRRPNISVLVERIEEIIQGSNEEGT